MNLSGHVLHSLYWQNMSPGGGDRPDGATLVQGSGWGVLSYEPAGKRLIVEQVYDHHGNVGQGSVPLLAFDAWEHAYYLQYRNVRPDFVKAM